MPSSFESLLHPPIAQSHLDPWEYEQPEGSLHVEEGCRTKTRQSAIGRNVKLQLRVLALVCAVEDETLRGQYPGLRSRVGNRSGLLERAHDQGYELVAALGSKLMFDQRGQV